jgi:hypothetical protein
MSRLGINTGNNPNDGQGDPLRVAMGKINSNFLEIYNTIGNGFELVSYASTAGISSIAENLTGSPTINVSGVLNTGITTTEHIEVRNIISTGVVTATQFVGDGSQLTNVTALVGGLEVLDDNVRMGVARELNFGQNIQSTGPDGVGRVTISVSNLIVPDFSNYAEIAGIATLAQGLTGTPSISVDSLNANTIFANGSNLSGIPTSIVAGSGISINQSVGEVIINSSIWEEIDGVISTSSNISIGTTESVDKLTVRGGDISVGVDTSHGLILTSPNGTRYRLLVDDLGNLSTVSL